MISDSRVDGAHTLTNDLPTTEIPLAAVTRSIGSTLSTRLFTDDKIQILADESHQAIDLAVRDRILAHGFRDQLDRSDFESEEFADSDPLASKPVSGEPGLQRTVRQEMDSTYRSAANSG